MITYLKIMLCIWVTLAVFRLVTDLWTIKFRAKKNKKLINAIYRIDDNINAIGEKYYTG